jgi:hypothetical protein
MWVGSASRLRLSGPGGTLRAMTSALGCAVYELRQYTLRPHVADAFVRLFEAEFLETQNATGAASLT